jgi:hypothetical protein
MDKILESYINKIKHRAKYFENFEDFCFAPFVKIII